MALVLASFRDELSSVELEAQHRELMKANERKAIIAILDDEKEKLLERSEGLKTWLEEQMTEMSTFVKNSLVSDLAEGFEGSAADSAKSFLTNLPQPTLETPYKSS